MDLTPVLAQELPPPTRAVLRTVSDLAASAGMQAYLVGGTVRDLLLRRDTTDLDVVVEGDAPTLARLVASTLHGRVRVHASFRTAKVLLGDGSRLDLASARTERYRAPGALPEVAPGGIRDDLFRRDFTVNALAVRLSTQGFGQILDFFGGREDLRQGRIRVLHDASFIEDPTRAFRAVRFASRLGFEIPGETAHLIRAAIELGVFERLSPARLCREVEHLLGGRHATISTRSLEEHGLLTVLHPDLTLDPPTYARLQGAEEVLAWYFRSSSEAHVLGWTVVLGALAHRLAAAEHAELLERLRPGRTAALVLRGAREIVPRVLHALEGAGTPVPSLVAETCRAVPTEILLLAMALAPRPETRRLLGTFLTDLRDVRPDIDGRDLMRAGVKEGPLIAVGLAAALRAKLDGRGPDAQAQLRAALDALGET